MGDRNRPVRQRYALLDGMRGIAAVAVVLFHFAWQAGWEKIVFPHAYLSVDFFFMLSGFVLVNAYYDRLSGGLMGIRTFILARVVRLYPMIFVGTCTGFVVHLTLLDTNLIPDSYAGLTFALVAGLVLEPFTYHPASRSIGFELLLDGPLWSLFWEMISNLLYGVVTVRIAKFAWHYVLAVFIVLITVYAWLHNGLFLGGKEWFAGFVRVGFAFFGGVVLWHNRNAFSFLRGSAAANGFLLTAILATPLIPHLNKFYDLLAVLIVFPAIIYSSSRVELGSEGARKVSNVLGELSYPLYATHGPFLWYAKLLHDRLHLAATSFAGLAIVAGGTIGTVVLSWILYLYVDKPCRQALGAYLKLSRGKLTLS